MQLAAQQAVTIATILQISALSEVRICLCDVAVDPSLVGYGSMFTD